MSTRSLVTATSILLALAAAMGCTGQTPEHAFDEPPGGGSGAGAGPVNSGTASSGSGDGFGDAPGVGPGADTGSGGDGDGTCAAQSYEAKPSPLDMLIMLDKSGSMNEPAGFFSTRWAQVGDALKSFVRDPGAAGLGVGLGYFPLETPAVTTPFSCPPGCQSCVCINGSCTCDGGPSCNASDYARPDIEFSGLPGAAEAVVRSIDGHVPSGDTPTGPALAGALNHAKLWAAAHPDHKTVVVLATDGEPTVCSPGDVFGIAGLASAAALAEPRVLTFVVGLGNVLGLQAIASAGGTNQALVVDGVTNVSAAFLDALNSIRQAALACEYAIPVPAQGDPDFDKVNVQLTPAGGAPGVLARVSGASACDAAAGGWYYDNPRNPAKILVCPTSCEALSSGATGKVEILLGCQTIIEQPR